MLVALWILEELLSSDIWNVARIIVIWRQLVQWKILIIAVMPFIVISISADAPDVSERRSIIIIIPIEAADWLVMSIIICIRDPL